MEEIKIPQITPLTKEEEQWIKDNEEIRKFINEVFGLPKIIVKSNSTEKPFHIHE